MVKILRRYKYKKIKYYNKLTFLKGNKKIFIDLKKLRKKYKIHGIIKFLKKDFKMLKKSFYHFNLQYSGHIKKRNYLLLEIKKRGFFKKNNQEKTPLYATNNLLIYKCFYKANHLMYENINNRFFRKSLPSTGTKKKLFNEINMRYKYLLDKFTKDQIFNAGVAVTGLKFIKKINFDDLK